MIITFGNIEIDTERFSVWCDGFPVDITPRPFALLQFLASNMNRIVTKDEIVDAVWDGRAVSDAALSTTMHSVRRAIGEDAERIRTVYGRGWQLVCEDGTDAKGLKPQRIFDAAPQIVRPHLVTVQPLAVISDNPELRFLADGISCGIVARLTNYSDVRVFADSNSQTHKDPSGISDRQPLKSNSDFIINGSIRSIGASVRISLHATEPCSAQYVWAHTASMPRRHDEAIEDAMVAEFASTMLTKLNEHTLAQVAMKDPESWTVWETYQRGREHLRTFDPEQQIVAVQLFERVISAAPNFSECYAALSYALHSSQKLTSFNLAPSGRVTGRNETRLRAHELAMRAVSMNSHAAMNWVALSRSHLAFGDFESAIYAGNRAVELNPGLNWAHFVLGYAYWAANKCDLAIDSFDAALSAGPHDPIGWSITSGKACALMLLERHEEALELARSARFQVPYDVYAHLAEICALSQMDRIDDAREAFARVRELIPEFSLELIHNDQPLTDSFIRRKITDAFEKAGVNLN